MEEEIINPIVEEKPIKKRSKTKYIIITIIFVLLLVGGILYSVLDKDKDEEEVKEPDNSEVRGNDISDKVKDITESTQGNYELSNITIVSAGASNIVRGNVKNTGSAGSVELQLKMYNSKTKRLMGTSNYKIESIGKGETKNFEISIIGDYSGSDQFKVEIMK